MASFSRTDSLSIGSLKVIVILESRETETAPSGGVVSRINGDTVSSGPPGGGAISAHERIARQTAARETNLPILSDLPANRRTLR